MSSLQRYVSTELTHFVGKNLPTEQDRYLILKRILSTGSLIPPNQIRSSPEMTPMLIIDHAKKISHNNMYLPYMVCFCDIPINDLSIHMKKYSRFGLSFLKEFLVQQGATPVFYVSSTSPATFKLPGSFTRADIFDAAVDGFIDIKNKLTAIPVDQWATLLKGLTPKERNALLTVLAFIDVEVFSYLKFFDAMTPDEDPDNFYMEREWRKLGPIKFTLAEVHRVILPASYAKQLRKDLPDYTGQVTFAD